MKFLKTKLFFISLVSFLSFFISNAQLAPVIDWQKTYGGIHFDYLNAMVQTTDGGYLCGGSSYSGISGDKTDSSRGGEDFWVIKLDATGNMLWQNTIGGNEQDEMHAIRQTTDGGFICAGYSLSDSSGNKSENSNGLQDFWIVKIDTAGNVQWQNTIGGAANDLLYSIEQTTDGGYICGGVSYSGDSGDKTEDNWDISLNTSDWWIIKLDSTGNIQWQNSIGGTNEDRLFSVVQTNDGGYICGGSSNSNISGDKTEAIIGTEDFWVVKLDPSGSIQWQNTIGGNRSDLLYTIVKTDDGGYVCGGWSFSDISGDKTEDSWGTSDYWVVKLDSLGFIQWDNTIGGTGSELMYGIAQTSDGGYICGGNSTSIISGDKTENSRGQHDYWVVKLNNLGIVVWDKTIGGSELDFLNDIFESDDGGYILVGDSESDVSGDKTQNVSGYWDLWIIKLHPDTITKISDIESANFNIFPIPATNEITISGYALKNNQTTQLTISDLTGKLLHTFHVSSSSINLSTTNWDKGVYFVQLISGDNIIQRKIIKI